MVVPGIGGAICSLLALFALHMLPVSYAGLGLIALGIGCMVAELYLPTFGALGVGGIIAFIFGAVMLIDTDVPGFGIPLWLIGSAWPWPARCSCSVASTDAGCWRARRMPIDQRRRCARSARPGWCWKTLVGRWLGRSAAANAGRCTAPWPLARGQHVLVIGRHGLLLEVRATDAAPIQSSTQGA
ncbi:hypothetical protein ACU4GD_25525 [Cupriavidus basilensis]